MKLGRGSILRRLRLALHVAVAVALTVRSSQIGGALHPYQRALANEWVRLLFFVDATAPAPIPFGGSDSGELETLTLPHFLLEIEEEIAASVEDEFFEGGFAARASALPVGMLFTINETRQHLHGAVGNYFRLANVALDSYVLFDNTSAIPAPELTVRSDMDDDTIEQQYRITDASDPSAWPEPLREDGRTATTRKFFDQLDAMQLKFVLGLKEQTPSSDEAEPTKMYVWRLVIRYDLQNQGHLEVAMNFDLKHMRTKPINIEPSCDIDAFFDEAEEGEVPRVVFDTDTTFGWGLLFLIASYQIAEFALKWTGPRALYRDDLLESKAAFVWRTLLAEAKDVWFWLTLVVNVSTVACLLKTWYHAYRLSLNDELCFVFAACCALHWISLVRYFQVNARFQILGLTLRRGLPRVMQFLAGVFPIFVGFVLFGTVMFGAKVPRFQTASATATTLFSVANGDEIHDTFNDVAYTPWIGQLYVYTYMILFSYVVLMVCIGIIEDAFFSAVFPASWPSNTPQQDTQGKRRHSHGSASPTPQ